MTRFDCYEDQRDHERAAHNRSIRPTGDFEPEPSDFWCDCDEPECRASHDDCDCPKACERHETHACDGCAKAFADGIGYAAGIVRECIGVPGQTGAQRSTLQALAKWLDGLSAAHEPEAMAEMRAEVEAIWSKRAKP